MTRVVCQIALAVSVFFLALAASVSVASASALWSGVAFESLRQHICEAGLRAGPAEARAVEGVTRMTGKVSIWPVQSSVSLHGSGQIYNSTVDCALGIRGMSAPLPGAACGTLEYFIFSEIDLRASAWNSLPPDFPHAAPNRAYLKVDGAYLYKTQPWVATRVVDGRYAVVAQLEGNVGRPMIAPVAACPRSAVLTARLLNAFLARFSPEPYIPDGVGD